MDPATPDSTTPALTLRGVTRIFDMGEVRVTALADVDLIIRRGEFVVVLGPSGSGKSTLLNLMGGIDRPTAGEVWYRDRELSRLSDRELTAYRRHDVGFIFQFYNLIPTLTARENVQVATELVGNPVSPDDALQHVELSRRSEHFPAQLSGGEQQRVAIARALAKKPGVLLADEPTGALDLPTARKVLSILQHLNRTRQLTIVLITHNPAIAEIAGRRVRMVSGRITESQQIERPIDAGVIEW